MDFDVLTMTKVDVVNDDDDESGYISILHIESYFIELPLSLPS